MSKPSGISNVEAKAASLELLPRAIKSRAIAKGAFPTVREIVEEAEMLSGRTLSTGWIYGVLGQGGSIQDFAASQGVYEAVVVDGSVYSAQTTDESSEQVTSVENGLGSMSDEQLHRLMGRISFVLSERTS